MSGVERYSVFDHEADIGIEVYGSSMEEIFKNSAYALFSILVGDTVLESEKKGVEKKIEVKGDGELLISFLNELLFLWETEGAIVKEVSAEIEGETLKADLLVIPFDPQIHSVKKEVKAATYHNFEIRKVGSRYVARIVLDV